MTQWLKLLVSGADVLIGCGVTFIRWHGKSDAGADDAGRRVADALRHSSAQPARSHAQTQIIETNKAKVAR